LKGRDWYDFAWYVAQGVSPRPELLRNALVQVGPWVGQEELVVDSVWLNEALTDRIHSIDWNQASQDVAPFLRAIEQESLKLWSERFFLHKLAKLQSTRTPDRRT
jgi:hypothetical protein